MPDELTDEQVGVLIADGIIDYLTLRDEQGMTHEEALDQVQADRHRHAAIAYLRNRGVTWDEP